MENNNIAGTGIRFLASFLDALIFGVVFGLIFYATTGDYSVTWTQETTGQLIYYFYLTITPVLWGGYIIGKRICRIKVKRIDDGNVRLSNMILREVIGNYLLGTVTFGISILISIFMIMFRKDKRGIHDFIGGTHVVYSS
ncbi:RDD family protein [Cytobacillus sp. FJAT-54145]|uniref:RDD family protein n=1 Tax=Cytobacillus spartinae TaxID=3299023 RepID=A0ABW6KAA1_9BACI